MFILTLIYCALCLRGWGFHAKPIFICNILKGDLYTDASITELFWIYLVVSQTPWRRYTCTNVFVGMRGRGGGVSSAWWQVRTALRFTLELVVGGNYVRRLALVVIYIYGIWTSRIKEVWETL